MLTVNTQFLESEFKKVETDHKKLVAKIPELRRAHVRAKDDVSLAKRDTETYLSNARRLEGLQHTQEDELRDVETHARQLKAELETTKRNLIDEKKVNNAAIERLKRANLEFDTIDSELQKAQREEAELKRTIDNLKRQLEKLGTNVKMRR